MFHDPLLLCENIYAMELKKLTPPLGNTFDYTWALLQSHNLMAQSSQFLCLLFIFWGQHPK